jgi:hypothetical protein
MNSGLTNELAEEIHDGRYKWHLDDGVWVGIEIGSEYPLNYRLGDGVLTYSDDDDGDDVRSHYSTPDYLPEIYEAIIAQQLEKMDENTPSPSHLDGPDG